METAQATATLASVREQLLSATHAQDLEPARTVTQPGRFVFVDGLRGFAALCIVIFHIWWYEPAPYPALDDAHWIVDAALLRVRGGVQILLVISGFVIAYTLRKTWVRPLEILSFIGRRVIRLVPAYWVAIASVILVDAVCRTILDTESPFAGQLSLSRIGAHMAFLQDVLGHDALGAGMWTLCIEMQFYFFAVVSWGIAQHLFPRRDATDPRPSMMGLLLVFAPIAFVSLFYWRRMDSTDQWVVHFLWMFFLGMMTWWTLDRTVSIQGYAFVVAVALINLVIDEEWRYENFVALATAMAIFTAGRQGELYSWLNWPWLQYLGKISYSLYLIHFPVCHLITTAGWKWCDGSPNSLQAAVILGTALICSIAAGHMLYVFVEAPTSKWSAKAKAASVPATAA